MANIVNNAVRGIFEEARELAFGDITNSFKRVGDPFMYSYSVIFVQNFTDVTIDFSLSYDGAPVRFSLAAGGALSTDMMSNGVQVSQGESAWAKYRDGAPSSGFVQVAAVSPI